jgi:hypothetical protein
MKHFSLRYSLLTYKLDQLWFPLSFWVLFVIIAVLVQQPDQLMNTTRAYLGAVVPLIGGIMAAYAVLDDPALELRFATPIPAWWTLFERLGLTFLIQAVTVLGFQGVAVLMGGDFSMFISGWYVQLAWILPTLALMALGCLGALATAQTTAGALFVGSVWIVELIARGWFANNAGKYFLVFMGALMPDHPDLLINHLSVFSISLIFILAAWVLLRRQERYI